MLVRLTLASIMAAGALTAAAATASAQYPPPVGNCVVTADATATDEGGTVRITITVRDLDGNLVQGEAVTMSVTSPSGDASIAPGGGVTNSDGVVSGMLDVGSTPGLVEVTAMTEDVSCRASVTVQGGEVEGVVELPETGGGTAGGFGIEGMALLLAAAGSLAVSAGLRHRRA